MLLKIAGFLFFISISSILTRTMKQVVDEIMRQIETEYYGTPFINFKDFGVFFQDITVIPKYNVVLNDLEKVAFVKNLTITVFMNAKLIIRGQKVDHTFIEPHMSFEIVFDDIIFKNNDKNLSVHMKRGRILLPPVPEIFHLQIFNAIAKDPFRIPTVMSDIFYDHFDLIVNQFYINDMENDLHNIFAAMAKRGRRSPQQKLNGGVLESYIHSMPAYTVANYGKDEIVLHNLETFWNFNVTHEEDSKVHQHYGKMFTEEFRFSKPANEFDNTSWNSTFPNAHGYLEARFMQEFDEEKDNYYK